jgi:hypothetical protein
MDEKQRMIDFLKANEACEEGLKFAIRECNSLIDCWDKSIPDWLVWLATRENVLTERELHEFMLASAESVKHIMKDQRSLNALVVKRRWLDGEATDEELKEARTQAYSARAAVSAQAAAHAYAAADYAASAHAHAYAAAAHAYAAADTVAVADAERCKQADWLRNNTKPNL